MRKRWAFALGAGQRWPDIAQETGGIGAMGAFNWVRIENRDTANPVLVLKGQDAGDYDREVGAGKVRVFNVAGPMHRPELEDVWWTSLYVTSAAGASAVVVEISDHPIVDLTWAI